MIVLSGLELFDLSDLTEACLTECEVEHVSTATETVLLGFQDAAAFEVLVSVATFSEYPSDALIAYHVHAQFGCLVTELFSEHLVDASDVADGTCEVVF